jgi:hypothetical protein
MDNDMVCRKWTHVPFLLSLAMCVSSAAQVPPQTVGPPPVLAHPDAGELPCLSYGRDTFVADDSVTKHFVPVSKSSARETLPPPCFEEVGAGFVAKVAASNDASKSSLNVLFGSNRTALERLQNGFDFYSWLTFIALNSPNDPTVSFGLSSAPVVWEQRFFPLDQVIRASEVDSVVNVSRLNVPDFCPRPAAGEPEPTLYVAVDDVAFDQPFKSGPLIDQDGNYSLNTIFMNSTMRTYIVDHRLYFAQGQKVFPQRIDFPVGSATPAALGSVMIKASWKVLTDSDDRAEFHTVSAYRVLPLTHLCEIKTLGLVGLHIVHKTEGRRQWIWTTFEHVRNVPSAAEVASGSLPQKSYLFYDVQRLAPSTTVPADQVAGLPNNVTPLQPWDADHPTAKKSQIVRAREISKDTTAINDEVHAYLKSLQGGPGFADSDVWMHYRLVSTQWPADFLCAAENGGVQTNQQTDPDCSPAPEFLPNSTLETYVQHDIGTPGGVPQSTSSCIGCHNNAVAYQDVNFGDVRSFSHSAETLLEKDCAADIAPTGACSPASDFTYILEQVCAPVPDPITHQPDNRVCKHDH